MNRTIKIRESLLHSHTFTGYRGGIPYLYYKTHLGSIDGIGRNHISLYGRCDTCDKEVLVSMIHCDEEGSLFKVKDKI